MRSKHGRKNRIKTRLLLSRCGEAWTEVLEWRSAHWVIYILHTPAALGNEIIEQSACLPRCQIMPTLNAKSLHNARTLTSGIIDKIAFFRFFDKAAVCGL